MDRTRPTAGTTPPVTATDLREAIGSLIVLWSRVETEFRDSLRQLDPQAPDLCASKMIERWGTLQAARATLPGQTDVAQRFLNRIEMARRQRNGIAHDFQGYSLDPSGHGRPVEIYYRSGKECVTLPYRQLQRTIIDLASAGFMLWRLTSAALNPDTPGTTDMLAEILHDLDRVAAEHPGTN